MMLIPTFLLQDAVDCPEWIVPFHVFKALAEEVKILKYFYLKKKISVQEMKPVVSTSFQSCQCVLLVLKAGCT